MTRVNVGLFTVLTLLCVRVGFAEISPKYYAVEASATVQAAPPKVTLTWPADSNATGYTIYRKLPEATSWGSGVSLSGGATVYMDTNVEVGKRYEYQLVKSTSRGYKGHGYITAGIEAPLIENRGKLILIVENTYASDLAAELARLNQDLIGDGWTVIRRDVSRNDTVTSVKQKIKAEYSADPQNVKAVFLFGRVPVPYSGNFNPDGHPDHQGAWPADAYYGDMDGTWTDSSVNTTSAERARNRNVPGDGKFDQSNLPSDVDLQVGRVDLANMTCFSNKTPSRSEKDLLRQYLNKHHNFRHNRLNVARRGLICDNFGERDGEAFAASGWRNFAPFFGAENVKEVPYGTYFSNVSADSYLWSYGTGGGSWYTCNGIGSSDDFATTDIKTVFTMFLGSYFGDWDNESNFLRAPLGSTSYALAVAWAGRPHWFFHPMALGETIGASTKVSQNNSFGGLYHGQNYGTRQVHVALMGDPTLRMHPVTPASNLSGTSGSDGVRLTWTASPDSNLRGYHVYRSASPSGPFTRITGSAPITVTSFVDSTAGTGTYTYMVRAIKLEQSGSGTYLNPSQGVFATVGATGGGSTVSLPSAPTSLTATATSTTGVQLSWKDTSTDETAFKIERKTGAGTYALAASVAAGTTSFADTQLASGTAYFYRVSAVNAAGASPYSNEASATTTTSTAPPASAANTATFVRSDSTTRGNWVGSYGTDGYQIAGYATKNPSYASVTFSGQSQWVWAWDTQDSRTLLKGSDSTSRIASTLYSGGSFTADLQIKDGTKRRVALYCLDYDTTKRSQRVEVIDPATGTILNAQTLSGFNGGAYLVWDVAGHVQFRFTRLGGFNAVLSGIFFGAPADTAVVSAPSISPAGGTFSGPVDVSLQSATTGASIHYTTNGTTPTTSSPLYVTPVRLAQSATLKARAFKSGMADSSITSSAFTIGASSSTGSQVAFVSTDTGTKGNWAGLYGNDGYHMPYNGTRLPSYAEVTGTGYSQYLWSDKTTDPRALQQTQSTTYRTAACMYSPTEFSTDVRIKDGSTHRVALYFLDWDQVGRSQSVQVTDIATGTILDQRTVSSFGGGKYLVWDVKGDVRFHFKRQAGNNAVLMGVFFGPAPAQLNDEQTPPSSGQEAETSLSINANSGQLELQVSSQDGQTILIEASSDLKNWEHVSTNIVQGGSVRFSDPSTGQMPHRFYRAAPVE